jgi:hypothetical protein
LDLRIEVKADEASEELAFDSFQVQALPEPGGLLSLASGCGALALMARSRRATARVDERSQ